MVKEVEKSLPVKQAILVEKYLEEIKNDGRLYKKVESVLALSLIHI